MTVLYSTFDQAELGSGLQLSNSDQTVTTTLPSLDIHRMVRCLYSLDFFPGNVEWLAYGTATVSTSNIVFGIHDTSTPDLTKYVGENTHGYGLRPDGALRHNNATVATASTTFTNNDIVGMVYDPLGPSLNFYKNGVQILHYVLPGTPATGPWYPAASLGSTATGDMSIFFNAGQQSFQFPLGTSSGWWTQSAQINPVRLASEDFTSLPTDTVPNAVYDGAVSNEGASLNIVRGVSFWPWRKSSASVSGGQSYGSVTIDDPLGVYDNLLSLDTRDAPFTILRVPAQEFGGSVDSAQAVATGIVERCDTAGDFQKTVYIKDAIAILDTPVQRSLFLPNVDASAVGHPLPIVAGACRSVPGILVKSSSPWTLQFTDAPIAQLGGPRVAGKLAVAGVDFNLTTDARSCAFDGTLYPNGPQGKVTADISTVGGSVIGLVDLLTADAAYTGTASGTDTYAVTLAPVPGSYVTGTVYTVTFTNGNTGASTLNANGLGAKAIQLNGAALTSGQIGAGEKLSLMYDGTQFQIVGNTKGGLFNTYASSLDLSKNFGIGLDKLATTPAWNAGGWLDLGESSGEGNGSYVYTKTNACRAGYTYIAEIRILTSPPIDPHVGSAAYVFASLVLSDQTYNALAWVYNPTVLGIIPPTPWAPLTVRLTFTNTTASAKPFVLGFNPNNVVGFAEIAYVKLYELPLATSAVNLSGMNLHDYMTLMIQNEGGLSAAVWQATDASDIDTLAGYTSIGNYISQSMTIRNALQPVLDSYCADLFIDRNGVIRTVRFVDPGTITSSGTIDETVILGPVQGGAVEAGVTIGSTQNSMIAMSQDHAPGLTTKAGARFNHSKWTQGDFGSTSLTDCPNTVRALLTQDYQSIQASGEQLANAYRQSQQAAPLRTCFDDPAEALTEITRVNALYTQLRFFYFVPVKADESDVYEIGQAWQLKYPRYGLDAGIPVMIVGITENPITEQVTLTCWG